MDTVSITCCVAGCGYSPFPMEQGFYNRAKRTHEWWHCPAGHSQHFVGETEEEKKHRREVEILRAEMTRWRETALRYREDSRTCPWPTCREFVYSSRQGLYDHMVRIHGMPRLAEVQEAS